MSRIRFIAALVCLMVFYSAVRAADPAPKSFPIPKHGDLLLNVPPGWTQTVEQGPIPGLPPTLKFSASSGQFEMLITPLPAPASKPDFNSPQNVKKLAEAQGTRMLSGSKETSLDLKELKGDKAAGYYFTLTDKAPDPGSFEYMTSASVGVGDLLLSVTMLHHQKDLPARDAGLGMLKTASQKPADPNAKQSGELRIAAPGATWALLLPGQGLEVMEDQPDPARKSHQITAVSQDTGLTVSVFIEPAQKVGDSTVARSVYWSRAQKSPMLKTDVRLAKIGDTATVEYMVPKMGDVSLNQKNMNLYLVHENAWIDVHISKTDFAAKDQPLFDQIAKNLKFDPH